MVDKGNGDGKLTAKERLAIERQKMPEQDGIERSKNFEEVNLGLPEEIAIREAQRCLQCKKAACVEGCPVEIDIPGFLKLIAERDFLGAAALIRQDNNLPAVTGRVCPQETQCEIKCVRCKSGAPVAIGWLERLEGLKRRRSKRVKRWPASVRGRRG